MQFVAFEKYILSAYLHQIAGEIMLFLANNLHENRITESQDGRNLGGAHAICNLNSYYMKNALVFSQPDARNFHAYYY